MNKKDTISSLAARVGDLLRQEKYDEAGALCEASIEKNGETAEALMLRSHCRAASGDSLGALDDHRAADKLLGKKATGAERLRIAESAMDARLPLDYCAELFTRASERLDSEHAAKQTVAEALNKAGICLYRDGADVRDEEACFRLALKAAEAAEQAGEGGETAVVGALVRSNLAECLMREGSEDEAATLYSAAADTFAEKLSDGDTMCLAHYAICQKCLSDIYRSHEENIQAHACLSKSIKELSGHKDKLPDQLRLHLAICCNARGTLRFQMGDYEGEVADCTQALELRKGLESDPVALGTVYSNRAEAYMQLERFEAAREDFLAAIGQFESIGESRAALEAAAVRYYLLGVLYDDNEYLPEACAAYRDAAAGFGKAVAAEGPQEDYSDEQLTDMQALCRMKLSAALLRCEEHDYFEALSENREAVRLTERLPLTVERAARLAALHTTAGELLESFDELEAAKEEYEQADELREAGVRQLMELSDDEDEQPEEEPEGERSIWEDSTGNTPQA